MLPDITNASNQFMVKKLLDTTKSQLWLTFSNNYQENLRAQFVADEQASGDPTDLPLTS